MFNKMRFLNGVFGALECKWTKALWSLVNQSSLISLEEQTSVCCNSMTDVALFVFASVRPWSWSWKRSGSSRSTSTFPRRGRTVSSQQPLCLRMWSATVSVMSSPMRRTGWNWFRTKKTTQATSMPRISRWAQVLQIWGGSLEILGHRGLLNVLHAIQPPHFN